MPGKKAIFFLFLLLSFQIKGHQDFYDNFSAPNMVYYAPPHLYLGDGETSKILIICRVIEEYNKSHTDKVYLRFNVGMYKTYSDGNIFSNNAKYFLGIDRQVFLNYPKFYYKRENAITLNVNTNNINLKECLQLIFYAIENKTDICENQKPILAKSDTVFEGSIKSPNNDVYTALYGNFDFINSISQRQINEVLNKKITAVEVILSRRLFDYEEYSKDYSKIGYYYFNDSFYYYKKNKHRTSLDSIRPIFVSEKFYRIVNDEKGENHFIFTSIDTFYHITLSNGLVTGPLIFKYADSLYHYFTYKGVGGVKTKNDSAIFQLITMYGDYNVIFRYRDNQVIIDSSTLSKRMIDRINEVRKTYSIMKPKATNLKIQSNNRKYDILILVAVVLIVNLFLGLNKRL